MKKVLCMLMVLTLVLSLCITTIVFALGETDASAGDPASNGDAAVETEDASDGDSAGDPASNGDAAVETGDASNGDSAGEGASPSTEAADAAELEAAEPAVEEAPADGMYVTGEFVLESGTAADGWDELFYISPMTFSPDDESVSLPVGLTGDDRFPTSPLGKMTAKKTGDGAYTVYDSTGATVGTMTVADSQVTITITAGPLTQAAYVAELEGDAAGEEDYLIDGNYVTGDFALTAGTAADSWEELFYISAMTFSPDDESVSLPVGLTGDDRFPTSPLGKMTAVKTDDGVYTVYDSTGATVGTMTVADGQVAIVITAGPLTEATYTAELQK